MRCRKGHLPVLSDGLLVAGGSLHHQLVVLYVDAFGGLAAHGTSAQVVEGAALRLAYSRHLFDSVGDVGCLIDAYPVEQSFIDEVDVRL